MNLNLFEKIKVKPNKKKLFMYLWSSYYLYFIIIIFIGILVMN
jgi:hypothetical protein